MRRWKLIVYPAVIVIAVLLSAACGGGEESPKPPQGPVETATSEPTMDVERLSESVVMVAPGIYSGRDFEPLATGSGTIVDESGLILTNFHVVDPDLWGAYDDIAVYMAEDPEGVPDLKYFGGLAAWDEELDLAVVRITHNRNGIEIDPQELDLKAVKLGEVEELDIGDDLTVLGYPAIGEGSLELTKGSVSGFLSSEGRKQTWVKTDARIAAGNSGGGAFDERGYLVGVPTAIYYIDELGNEGSGRVRPVDLALDLLEEAKATTQVVIPSPNELPVPSEDLFGDELPLLSEFDLGSGFVLTEEIFLTNEDRAYWYTNPDEAIDFYESYGRLGGVQRVFDNFDAAESRGEAPYVIVTQIDVYETEQGAAGAASECDEYLDTMWEFVSAIGLEFYEPEYISDPMIGNESCLFGTEEIVGSTGEPPVILGFIGFRQGNVLVVVGALSLEDPIASGAVAYLATLQSNRLASELGLVVPPRQPNVVIPPAPQPPQRPPAAPPRQPTPLPPPPQQPIGYWTPEDAIGAYWASYGLPYVGDCAFADPYAHVGWYCSLLAENLDYQRVYLIGLTFSEADTALILNRQVDGSWLIVGEEPLGPIGYFSPEDAIGAYLSSYGAWYVGDCALANVNTDAGSLCSMLWEDRGYWAIYIIGLTFSDVADTWIMVQMYDDGSFGVTDEALVSYDAWGNIYPPPW